MKTFSHCDSWSITGSMLTLLLRNFDIEQLSWYSSCDRFVLFFTVLYFCYMKCVFGFTDLIILSSDYIQKFIQTRLACMFSSLHCNSRIPQYFIGFDPMRTTSSIMVLYSKKNVFIAQKLKTLMFRKHNRRHRSYILW